MIQVKAWGIVICFGVLIVCAVKYALLPSKQEIQYQRTYSKVFNDCINSKEQRFALELVAGMNGQTARSNVLAMAHRNICEDKAKKEAKT
jgi:hypothetical protein